MKKGISMVWLLLITCYTFSQSDTIPSQYIFPDFYTGTVKLKLREPYEIPVNYHTGLGQMIYVFRGQKLAIANTKDIEYILIEGRKFIPVGKVFYEEIVAGKYPGYVQYSSKLQSKGKPAGYGSTSETAAISQKTSITISGQYVELAVPTGYKMVMKEFYYVPRDNRLEKVISVNQLAKLFPEKAEQIKSYAKKHRIRLKSVEDFKKILTCCLNETADFN